MTDKEIKEWANEQITEIKTNIELTLLALHDAIFQNPFPKEFFKSTHYKLKGLNFTRLGDVQYYGNIQSALADYIGHIEAAELDIPRLEGLTNATIKRDVESVIDHMLENDEEKNVNLWHAL